MWFYELRTKKKSCPSPVGIVHKFKAYEKTVHLISGYELGVPLRIEHPVLVESLL